MPATDSTAEKQRNAGHANIVPHQFKPGETGNPSGRPKGSISIKDKVRQYLEDNPEHVASMVRDFVHKRPELVWQMLEGKPGQKMEHSGPNDAPLIPSDIVISDVAKKLNAILGTGGVGGDGDAAGPVGAQAPDTHQ